MEFKNVKLNMIFLKRPVVVVVVVVISNLCLVYFLNIFNFYDIFYKCLNIIFLLLTCILFIFIPKARQKKTISIHNSATTYQ